MARTDATTGCDSRRMWRAGKHSDCIHSVRDECSPSANRLDRKRATSLLASKRRAVTRHAPLSDQLSELPTNAFQKEDTSDDALFYLPARLVTHIDEAATAALTAFYRSVLPDGGVLLDLMSSWVSHLPPEMQFAEVIGQGMNAEELRSNPRLNRSFVQDLNRNPTLPLDDESCDAAMCCVGVQYLERPVGVFAEVRRVLRPEGCFVVSFSNRCFPTKAMAIWRSLDDRGHAALVQLYFEHAGFRRIATHVLKDGRSSDPLVVVAGYR